MYKIGEFSKITELSVKTLRYYDEENILNPSYRNQENGYRYYSEEDYDKAMLLVLLRKLNFSIMELKDVLKIYQSKSDLPYILKEKKVIIQEKIEKEKALLKEIDLFIHSSVKEKSLTNYQVDIRTVAAVYVASIRFQGKYNELGKYITEIYKDLKGNGCGNPFTCYYEEGYKEIVDIEVCVPTKKKLNTPTIQTKELPEIKAIHTVHYGHYDELGKAYKTIIDYAKRKNLNCVLPSREIYVKGPGMIFKGNPNNYVTEILVPFED